jgi:acetolactate decarboxylase
VVTAERRYAPTVMTPSPVPGAAVTQFAVIDALLAGAYESGLRVAEARSIGDFGLGCVDHLGGEVLIVDGEAIECTLDGPPVAMDDDDILPFAIVCRFPDVPRVGLGEQDFAGFAASVEAALTSRNLFHAVAFRRRAVGGPRAGHASSASSVSAARRGDESPGRDGGARHPRHGGRILDAGDLPGHRGRGPSPPPPERGSQHRRTRARPRRRAGDLHVAAFARFDLHLPTDDLFLRTELTHAEDHRIVAVEGGVAVSAEEPS